MRLLKQHIKHKQNINFLIYAFLFTHNIFLRVIIKYHNEQLWLHKQPSTLQRHAHKFVICLP